MVSVHAAHGIALDIAARRFGGPKWLVTGAPDSPLGELSEQGAAKLLADAAVPGVGNVLERLSDELRIESSSTEHSREELVLTVRFG